MSKINEVQRKYKIKKIDKRYNLLKETGLFKEKEIKLFLQDKNKKEKKKVLKT